MRSILVLCALLLSASPLLGARVAYFVPADPVVAGRVTLYDTSANTTPAILARDGVDLKVNPDVSGLNGVPWQQWKWNGSAIVAMTAPELAAIASAEAAAQAAADEAAANALAAQVRAGDGATVVFRGAAFILANSNVETDLLAATIPANLLETRRVVRITLAGDRLNNSGATEAAATLRVRLNGTIVYADPVAALATNAARVPWRLEVLIATVNDTQLVAVDGTWSVATAGGATTGIGNSAADAITVPFAAASPVSFNTTNPIPVRVSFQLGTAAATVDLRLHIALVELL